MNLRIRKSIFHNIVIAFGTCLTFVACNNYVKETKQISDAPTEKYSKVEEEKTIEVEHDEGFYEEDFTPKFAILLPSSYRDWNDENTTDQLSMDWFDLHLKNGKYFLAKPNFKRERSYDPCSGDSTTIIKSKHKTTLFLEDGNLQLGEVKHIQLSKDKLWPKEKIEFQFNGNTYTLSAEGNVLKTENWTTDDGTEIFKYVDNYRLYISVNGGPTTVLFSQDSFEETFTKFLFIGDLNRDGYLDFILESNRHYEEQRAILIYSMWKNNRLHFDAASHVFVGFDC